MATFALPSNRLVLVRADLSQLDLGTPCRMFFSLYATGTVPAADGSAAFLMHEWLTGWTGTTYFTRHLKNSFSSRWAVIGLTEFHISLNVSVPYAYGTSVPGTLTGACIPAQCGALVRHLTGVAGMDRGRTFCPSPNVTQILNSRPSSSHRNNLLADFDHLRTKLPTLGSKAWHLVNWSRKLSQAADVTGFTVDALWSEHPRRGGR